MKIRQDFVTNSSSTSFGAAAALGFGTAITSAVGISSAVAAANAAADLPGLEAKESQSCPNRDLDPDDFIHSDIGIGSKLAQLDHEIKEYEKEWERTKDSLEGSDYDESKKVYEDYIEYLGEKKEQAKDIEFEKQVERLTREAEAEAIAEHKQDWIGRRKDDLKNTREQIAIIEANIKGYGGAGYDISEAKSQLEMFKGRERDLDKTLKKEGVDYEFKAKKREPIGPSKSIEESLKKIDEKYEAIFEELKNQKITRKKKEIIERNMKAWRAEGRAEMWSSRTMDMHLKLFETIQAGADLGVDALEKVTGPTGKTIKKVYVAGKGLAGGAVDAYWDPANTTSHLIKGTIKGASDVAKEYTDNKLIKDGIGMGSEMVQGAIGSYQKGENLSKGMVEGVKKAGVDIVVGRITDKLMPDSARDIDFGDYSTRFIYDGIVKGNPTLKTFIKDAFKDSIKNNLINQGKNVVKGDGFIYTDWKLS